MRVEPIDDAIRRRTRGKNWPKLSDFQRDAVFVSSRIRNEILYGLRVKRNAVLIGSEGRGKSTVAEVIGFRQHQAGERVYVIDCAYEGSQTSDQIGTFIVNRDSNAPLWIIDDIQLDPDGMSTLYDFIENTTKSRFLFVWRRKVPSDVRKISTDQDWLDDVLDKSTVVSMVPTEETIREVITCYVNDHRQEKRFAGDNFLQSITPDYLSQMLELTGGNLRTLTRYLQIWDPRRQPLNSLEPEAIREFIKEDRLKPLLNAGAELLESFVAIAAVYQFDVAATANVGTPASISELENRGLIVNYGEALFGLAHSSDAREVITAFASMTGKTASEVTDASLARYIQLPELPLSHSLRLIKSLRDATWYAPSSDIRARFADWAADSPIEVNTQYIRTFCRTPSELRSFIDRIGGKDYVKEAGGYTDIRKLRSFLAAVRRLDVELAEELESPLSISDKVAMYSRTRLSALVESLSYYAKLEKSRHFAGRILGELMKSDLAARIERSSIRVCGILMWCATEIDSDKARMIAEVLAEHVPLATADNSEELSLLIRNLSVNEPARLRAIQRLVTECKPEALLVDGKPNGYSFLLTAIGNAFDKLDDQSKAPNFFSYLTTKFPADKLEAMSDGAFAASIWNVWRMGVPIEPFLIRYRKELVQRLGRADSDSLLWLLWGLLQASDNVYKQVVADAKPAIEQRIGRKRLKAAELSVAGILQYTATPLPDAVVRNLSDDVASALLERPHPTRILFALLGAQQAGDDVYQAIRSEMEKSTGDLNQLIDELISQNPIVSTQMRLRAIVDHLGLNKPLNGNAGDQPPT